MRSECTCTRHAVGKPEPGSSGPSGSIAQAEHADHPESRWGHCQSGASANRLRMDPLVPCRSPSRALSTTAASDSSDWPASPQRSRNDGGAVGSGTNPRSCRPGLAQRHRPARNRRRHHSAAGGWWRAIRFPSESMNSATDPSSPISVTGYSIRPPFFRTRSSTARMLLLAK